jgi:dual specificity MAP kinase phosphatase
MCSMSRASEIANNVWLGSTADVRHKEHKWGVVIEACDLAPLPETLKELLELTERSSEQLFIDFPGSGTISPANWSKIDVDGIIDMCKWVYAVANGEYTEEEHHDPDGDFRMTPSHRLPRKILIHCTDGYTETSLLALAYIMFAEVLPVHDAWIKLHTEKKRNFFAYDKDLAFLRYIEGKLLDAAVRNRDKCLKPKESPPEWLYRMDGSLPSRVLPYMYLGNLLHANNCGLLQALGIQRVLSIGEEVSWTNEERKSFGEDNVMTVKDLQDNGCDPLEYQFRRCLDFIGPCPCPVWTVAGDC